MSIKKVVVPSVLAGSLVGSLVAVSSAGPASAGSGTSQEIKTRLNLETPLIANFIGGCDDGECSSKPLVEPTPVQDLEFVLQYTYKATGVESAPDVATFAGKLVGLPPQNNGTANICEGKQGIALVVSGAKITTSSTELKVNAKKHESSPSPTSTSLAEASRSTSSTPVPVAEGTSRVRCLLI